MFLKKCVELKLDLSLRVKGIKNLSLPSKKLSESSIKRQNFRVTASEHNFVTHICAITENYGPILENLIVRKFLQIG